MLAEKYANEIGQILAKYPPEHKRSAVLPLMYLAHREYGYVTPEAAEEIAAMLDLETTQVSSLIGFYTLLHDQPGGKYRIQICTDLPCALRGAIEFTQGLCKKLGVEVGETTADGMFTVEQVKCLAACDKAPMFQIQGPDGIHYHELQSVESALEILEDLREDETDA